MSRNNPTNQHQNKKDTSSQRIRKATFALGHADDSNRGHTTESNVHKPTNSKSNSTINNTTHKQKKHKQNNSNNNTKNVNNNNTTNDKSKVTSYFGAGPARTNERVKNSRASQLKNNKGSTVRKGSSSEITFNHKNRYDVNITLHATTLDARLIELQQNIDALMAIIIEEDEHAKLLPWKQSKQARHPAITSSEDTTGSFTDIYLSRSWLGNMEAKHRLYMKLHIGHNKSYSNHILPALEDWNSHSDQQFKYCMLQAEETAFIGWFLYSTLSIDAGALSDAIYDEYKIEVGLRWMDIRMSTQGKKSNKAKPVKAIHVETEKSKGRSTMETLMKCYGRSFDTTRNFPNGIRLRFCKNLDNAAYKLEKTKLINLRSRQNQLLAETNKTTTAGILDLDIILKEEVEVNEETSVTTTTITTLRDAIMAIQSKYVKDTPLFRSVDLSYNSEEYVFAYHQSMADEAKAMVDYLYPYLVHIYDKKALKKGFDSIYIQEMSSFQYNMITDEVEDIIAESSYAMMKDDKITGAQSFMEFDLSAMSLEEEGTRPQASILGKMYSGQDSISTQHHAGRSRIPQATSEEILEITPDELKELQQAMLLHTQTKNKLSERKKVLHIANMDTNTMLKQIRARKEEQNNLGQNQDKEEYTDNSQSSEEEQDDSMQDDNDDEQYQDCEEKQTEAVGDEKMEEEISDDDMESSRGGTSIDEDIHSSNGEATDHTRISQSDMISDEPPTPMREGGRG
jgi:hypothetical protein